MGADDLAPLSARPGYHQVKRSRYLGERAIRLEAAVAATMRSRFGRSGSHPLHKTVDHLLLAGLFERDGKLVAIDFHDMAVTEFLVKHAVFQFEFRDGPGRFGNQLALDRHWGALVAREAAGIAARREWRLAFVESGSGLAIAAFASRAVGLRSLPAWGRIAGTERLHIVEARWSVATATAPSGAALRLRDLHIRCRQLV